ncbi:MAG: alpha-galactosidase, partial [Tepidisphaeraceae bacterium]
GIDPTDLKSDEWTDGYSVVFGVASGGREELCRALRQYQLAARVYDTADQMIVVNTWGDRNRDTKLNEAFVRKEMTAAADLGASHLQLDDGWQSGRSGNSAFAGGTFDGIWDRDDYWSPHPQKFPAGLKPLIELSQQLCVEIGLWFNPSKENDFAHWRDDAEQIVRLHREHGIRLFKIDGVDIPSKAAERNLSQMLEYALSKSDRAIRFNLDVTAGRRFGYFLLNEYGNKFLENRYTDYQSYYPHWTLRNLWQLAKYLPLQGIQSEFLNVWRNRDRYPADDPLSPSAVGFAYAFACTLAAQPLAWMEASALPEAAKCVFPLIRQYRSVQDAWHRGQILPIGEEPSGFTWTGFESCREDGGFVLVYRERHPDAAADLKLWAAGQKPMRFTHVLGTGEDFTATPDEGGRVRFNLDQPMSFGLYRYDAD